VLLEAQLDCLRECKFVYGETRRLVTPKVAVACLGREPMRKVGGLARLKPYRRRGLR